MFSLTQSDAEASNSDFLKGLALTTDEGKDVKVTLPNKFPTLLVHLQEMGPENTIAYAGDKEELPRDALFGLIRYAKGGYDDAPWLYDALVTALARRIDAKIREVKAGFPEFPDHSELSRLAHRLVAKGFRNVYESGTERMAGGPCRNIPDCRVLLRDVMEKLSWCMRLTHDPVNSVGFSKDGKRVVSGSWDNTVRIWDATTGAQLHELKGHTNWVKSVGFSPDGERVVSGSADKTVRIWDAESGAQLHELRGHSRSVNSVGFSSDGKRVVSGSRDNTVRIWDATTGAQLHELTGHSSLVYSVGFSPDGKRVVSGSADSTVRIWNAESGTQLHELTGHSSSVFSVDFSPDGKRVVSGSRDNTAVRIWNIPGL
jgi:uncharacterized protein with WD repeat